MKKLNKLNYLGPYLAGHKESRAEKAPETGTALILGRREPAVGTTL